MFTQSCFCCVYRKLIALDLLTSFIPLKSNQDQFPLLPEIYKNMKN